MKNKKKVRGIISRILAVIALLMILIPIVIFIYMIITGSKYIIQMLFVVIICPIIIYIFIWLSKVFGGKEEEE